MQRITAACWAACVAVCAHAADDRAERDRIAAESRVVEDTYAARERECLKRFVVTACLNEAKRVRREALDPLRRQRNMLDEAERRQRSADRLEAIRVKREEQVQRDARAASSASGNGVLPRALQALPAVPAASAPEADVAASGAPKAPASRRATGATTPQQAAERRRAAEERQQDMKARRDANEQRNADRAATSRKPKAAPLPVPGTSTP